MRKRAYLCMNAALLIVLSASLAHLLVTMDSHAITQALSIYQQHYVNCVVPSNLDPGSAQDEFVLSTGYSLDLYAYERGSLVRKETIGMLKSDDYFVDLATGNLFASHDGDEVVAVTSVGRILAFKRSAYRWSEDPINVSMGRDLTKIVIGDVDGGHEGNEVIIAGDRHYVHEGHPVAGGVVNILWRRESGEWNVSSLEFSKPIHFMGICDFDNGRAGSGLVVADGAGGIWEVVYSGSGQWSVELLLSLSGGNQFAVGDVYPLCMGQELVTVERDQLILGYWNQTGDVTGEVIWKNPTGTDLESVSICMTNPNDAASGIITGNSDRLHQVHFENGLWMHKVFLDLRGYCSVGEMLKYVRICDVDAGHAGNETVLLSYWGADRLGVVYERDLVDRMLLLLPWAGGGAYAIWSLDLVFLYYDRRQMKIRRFKALGFTKCPVCGKYVKPDELDEHVDSHNPTNRER